LRRVAKSEATNRTPIAMIRTAAILFRVSRFSWSVLPSPVAVSPRRMKIAEKLATKRSAGRRTRRHPASSMSSGATPLTAER
jgi:hypothetical protein